MPMMLLMIWMGLCMLVGFAGRKRSIGFWGFFIASIFLTPILTMLVLLVTAPRE